MSEEEKKELLNIASVNFGNELEEEIEKIENEDKELQEKISKVKNLIQEKDS